MSPLILFVSFLLGSFITCAGLKNLEELTYTLQGHDQACNVETEKEFLKLLSLMPDTDLEWAEDSQYNVVCNPFKYLSCDPATFRCGCCNNESGHLFWDSAAVKCKVKIGGRCNDARHGVPSVLYTRPCFEHEKLKPLSKYIPEGVASSECEGGEFVPLSESHLTGLLEFGNNDFANEKLPKRASGHRRRTPCDVDEENTFHKELQRRANETNLDWMSEYTHSCNILKYLRCEPLSRSCVCWHKHLFWAPNEIRYNSSKPNSMDWGRYAGRCRVMLDRTDSCSALNPVHTVLDKYKKPFGLTMFDRIPSPVGAEYEIKTLDSKHLKCVKNSWDHFGHFECRSRAIDPDPCKSSAYFIGKEIKILTKERSGGKDTDWNFHPNDICDDTKQVDFLVNKEAFTWNFEKIRLIIYKKDTRLYCNPFAYQECSNGLCRCPRAGFRNSNSTHHGEKTDLYFYRYNKCIPQEGITCSRRYWYNGNWADVLDECEEPLTCMLAPDLMNYVCCNEDEMIVNRIPATVKMKGRCRDQLLYNKGYDEHFTLSGTQTSNPFSKFMKIEFYIAFIDALYSSFKLRN